MADLSSSVTATAQHARDVVAAELNRLGPRLLAASGDVEMESKGDGTPVTASDFEADAAIASAIAHAFPEHGIVSEEQRTSVPDTEWTWIVDPIDGTSNFICRLPYWCVSIALAHQGRPVLGVVDAPALGRRYTAVAGQGARVQTRFVSGDGSEQVGADRRLRVRRGPDWRSGRNRHVPLMLTTATARRVREAKVRLNSRVMGSNALDLAFVAEGVAAASIAVIPRVWDVAAGGLIVEESGGVLLTVRDAPLLPLEVGEEYGKRSATTVAGPTERYTRELAERLLPPRVPGGAEAARSR